jgi:hypothetical protein
MADKTWPLSLFQRTLVFHPHSRFWTSGLWFTLNAIVEITGPFDHRVLRAALDELIRRHELLRTRIIDGLQVVAPSVAGVLELTDEVEIHVPVPTTNPSPLVVRLTRLDADKHALSLHLHHFMGDPATLWAILTELGALYTAELGRAPKLPAPSAQYGEYAQYEVDLEQAGRAEAEQWWRNSLGNATFGAVREHKVDDPFATREQLLDAEATTAVERSARRHRSTLLSELLAGLACSMRPHIGEGDLLYRTIFTRRDRPEWQRMLGACVVQSYIPLPRPPERLTAEYSRAVRERVLASHRYSRFDLAAADALARGAASTFLVYIPLTWPSRVTFGPATGAVVDAAGPKDLAPAGGLGFRVRPQDGCLFGHVSGPGTGWTLPVVREVWRSLPALLESDPVAVS